MILVRNRAFRKEGYVARARSQVEKDMANKERTVKEMEALKKFPLEAKVYYEMGPNGPGTIGKAQYRQGLGRGRSNGSATGPIA